jgi:hypothetical protein
MPASPLIVDDTVYVGTEEGTVLLFHLSAEESAPFAEIDVNSMICAAPIFANGVLYLTNRNRLYAIQQTAVEQ